MSSANVSFSSLSPPRRRLVRLMCHLHYGRIEHLNVRAGQPVFDHGPLQITREIKFPSQSVPRPEPEGDFLLKAQVLDLFHEFDRLGDAAITLLDVRDGLPFRLLLSEPAR